MARSNKTRVRVASSSKSKSNQNQNQNLPPRRLYTRVVAAHVLNTSVSTLRRLERSGKLTPIKLAGVENSVTHYPVEEVHALAQLPAESEAV